MRVDPLHVEFLGDFAVGFDRDREITFHCKTTTLLCPPCLRSFELTRKYSQECEIWMYTRLQNSIQEQTICVTGNHQFSTVREILHAIIVRSQLDKQTSREFKYINGLYLNFRLNYLYSIFEKSKRNLLQFFRNNENKRHYVLLQSVYRHETLSASRWSKRFLRRRETKETIAWKVTLARRKAARWQKLDRRLYDVIPSHESRILLSINFLEIQPPPYGIHIIKIARADHRRQNRNREWRQKNFNRERGPRRREDPRTETPKSRAFPGTDRFVGHPTGHYRETRPELCTT